jgi:sodium transport system permease protein
LSVRTAFTVLGKELRDGVRDRRTLTSGLFYGVWGPLVMALAVTAIARDRAVDDPMTVAAEGENRAPALASFLAARGVTLQPVGGELRERVRRRDADVAVVIDGEFDADFFASRPATVTVVYDGARAASKSRAERVKTVLGDYARQVTASRLVVRGVSPAVASLLDLQEQDLSTAAARAALVVAPLPIFVLISAFVGGMGIAADATAGERERGSLESLLLYPVSRFSIAAGKWGAAAVIALATVTVTVAITAIVLRHPKVQSIDLPIGLSMTDAALVWGIMAPLALFAPALQLLIGLLSRTFKEANTHLSLLMFAPMIPGFLFAFGTVPAQPWMQWTPVIGQHLMIASVVRGDGFAPLTCAALTLFSAAAAVAAVAFTARLLNQETIVRHAG